MPIWSTSPLLTFLAMMRKAVGQDTPTTEPGTPARNTRAQATERDGPAMRTCHQAPDLSVVVLGDAPLRVKRTLAVKSQRLRTKAATDHTSVPSACVGGSSEVREGGSISELDGNGWVGLLWHFHLVLIILCRAIAISMGPPPVPRKAVPLVRTKTVRDADAGSSGLGSGITRMGPPHGLKKNNPGAMTAKGGLSGALVLSRSVFRF